MDKEIEIEITRLDPTLPLPEYQTDGAVAFDITAFEDAWIEPKAITRIKTGLILSVPDGFALIIANRSSGPVKLGASLPHGVGIIDQDYRGAEDELLIQLTNITEKPIQINKGTRIAQGLIFPVIKAKWKEIPRANRGDSRGGFGNTGYSNNFNFPDLGDNFPAIDELTEEEKAKLQPFVTNMDRSIFALKNLPQEVAAALFSRYSRTSSTLKEVLVREFLKDADISDLIGEKGSSTQSLESARERADKFFQRVLAAFGDESVAELGGAHIAIEAVSMLAVETLEKPRIGLSPLEKSTRYVEFDDLRNDRYQYYLDPKIRQSEFASEYVEFTNYVFAEYSRILEPLKAYLKKKFPQDQETSDRAYSSTIRAKTCDVLRLMLPMSTQANLGIFGNGRSFEYLINRLFASPLTEANHIGILLHHELSKIIPSFTRRPFEQHGQDLQNYLKNQQQIRKELYFKYYQELTPQKLEPSAKIIRFDTEAEINLIAASMFTESQLPLTHLRQVARNMSFEEQKQFIQKAAANRKNRFQKLSRAFEAVRYELEITADIGVFKDFKRHRICSQERQPYSTLLGFVIPQEIQEVGEYDRYCQVMERASSFWQRLHPYFPVESEYIIPMAYLMRLRMEMNLRELAYIIEIRSTPAGHPSYRYIAQEMHRQLAKIQPHFAKIIHCNYEGVELERLKSELKIDEKLTNLKNL